MCKGRRRGVRVPPACAATRCSKAACAAPRSCGPAPPYKGLEAWILSITSNHCVDLLRTRARDAKLFGDFDAEFSELESSAPAPLDTLVDAERATALQAAIATLPDKYRLPIVLAYYNESSYDEIA